MIPYQALADFPLLQDLPPRALQHILTNLNRRTLDTGEFLCRQGEHGESLFLIESGLVEVWLETDHDRHLVRRLRQGDIVGEMALLTGEPRSADVIANVPSVVLELDASTFAAITAAHPRILHNITRVLIEREHASASTRLRGRRGESVALILGEAALHQTRPIMRAAERAAIRRPLAVDLTDAHAPADDSPQLEAVSSLLARLDALLHEHERVLVILPATHDALGSLLRHMDRAVLLMEEAEARRLEPDRLGGLAAELILQTHRPEQTPGADLGHRLARVCPATLRESDVAWLGRHLTRTKLGLALGAGGAKGFAHVGAFRVLEDAGYVFDYVAGASIGSILGSGVAMGMSGERLSATARWLLSREVCGTYFRLVASEPDEPGHQRFYDALSEFAGNRTFSDLPVPLAVMTADLNAKRPFVFQSGVLEEALHAALSIPGLAPPFERPGQRLVDGVTISPVPTDVLKDMGADITVSVNLMSREELERWPEEGDIAPVEKRRSKTLDPMIEVLIMLQLDTSMRNAAAADVAISPLFAPSSWRDIHFADRFKAAGRRAALAQLPALQALARPQGA
jgi:predicted acylesterase/phospholipase RssA/CRP-like cAMP-binding protein